MDGSLVRIALLALTTAMPVIAIWQPWHRPPIPTAYTPERGAAACEVSRQYVLRSEPTARVASCLEATARHIAGKIYWVAIGAGVPSSAGSEVQKTFVVYLELDVDNSFFIRSARAW
jgi:hypothetical protein